MLCSLNHCTLVDAAFDHSKVSGRRCALLPQSACDAQTVGSSSQHSATYGGITSCHPLAILCMGLQRATPGPAPKEIGKAIRGACNAHSLPARFALHWPRGHHEEDWRHGAPPNATWCIELTAHVCICNRAHFACPPLQ